MAEITIRISNTGENIPTTDIPLDEVTNDELLAQLVECGFIDDNDLYGCHCWRVLDSDRCPVLETVTLAEIGIKDGDTLTIMAKPNGAAKLTLKVSFTGEMIPVYNVCLDTVTCDELLQALIDDNIVTIEEGTILRVLGINNVPIMDGNLTLANVGITNRDTLTVLKCVK